MMSMQQEQKQADLSLRGDKDDYKRQSVELRQSRELEQPLLAGASQPTLSADPLAPKASVPLEPTVQAPRKIEHIPAADIPFTSMPDSSSRQQASSGPAMMEQVGQQAGAGIDAAKGKLQATVEPLVNKATSIYEQWQADSSTSTGPSMQERATAAGSEIKGRATAAASQAQTMYTEKVAPTLATAANKAGPMMQDAANKAGPMLSSAVEQAKPMLAQASAQAQTMAAQARPVLESAIEQAKPILSSAAATAQKIYAEQVQPALASGLSAAQEQIAHVREDGLSATMEKAGTAYQRKVSAVQHSIVETYETKVPREQREQITAAKKAGAKQLRYGWNRVQDMWETQALPFIRERKLQAPLAIVGSLLLLLLGWSLLHMLSASRASHEQVVVYQPDWRPSTGPELGAEMPGLMDKVGAKLGAMDNKLMDEVDYLKARTADLAQHAEDRVIMGVDGLKIKAQELKDSIPSAAGLKASIPSTADIKAAMPGAAKPVVQDTSVLGSIKSAGADLKAKVNGAIHPAPIKEPSVLDNIKSNAAELKARAEASLESAKASIPSTADIKAAMPGAKPIVKDTSVLGSIKAAGADLKERIHPTPVEPTMMDNIKGEAAELKARAADLKHRAEATIDGAKLRAESGLENAKLRAENAKLRTEANIHSARASIPSSAEVKARAESTIDSARASIPSTADIKASIPSATEAAHDSSMLDSLKDSADSLKARALPSELRLKINDRLEHVKHLLPEQLSALKLRLGNLYERLTPAQRHFAHAHPEVLDPENHAVSFVDEHGNAKSILDIDLE